ncbi:MAG TPA: GNAT family N-acetyltransferase [Sphingobium sp.]|nr:GNAT family N-acetyltransferase [Sphingobium sp.]
MSIILRSAVADDLPAMLALYRHLSPEDPPLPMEEAEPNWQALLASPLSDVLVAQVDGVVAATCLLLIVPNLTRGGRPFAMIENVVTDAAWRRRGLGSQLLALARERAQMARCYKIMLATGRTDAAVLRFYEQAGFTRGGKTFFEMRWLA